MQHSYRIDSIAELTFLSFFNNVSKPMIVDDDYKKEKVRVVNHNSLFFGQFYFLKKLTSKTFKFDANKRSFDMVDIILIGINFHTTNDSFVS